MAAQPRRRPPLPQHSVTLPAGSTTTGPGGGRRGVSGLPHLALGATRPRGPLRRPHPRGGAPPRPRRRGIPPRRPPRGPLVTPAATTPNWTTATLPASRRDRRATRGLRRQAPRWSHWLPRAWRVFAEIRGPSPPRRWGTAGVTNPFRRRAPSRDGRLPLHRGHIHLPPTWRWHRQLAPSANRPLSRPRLLAPGTPRRRWTPHSSGTGPNQTPASKVAGRPKGQTPATQWGSTSRLIRPPSTVRGSRSTAPRRRGSLRLRPTSRGALRPP